METSTNLNFYLPSSNSDEIADINRISDNFINLDEYLPNMFGEVKDDIGAKQDVLVSGENIKSVNGNSLLGEGDLELSVEVDQNFDAKSQNAQSGVAIANTFANALKGNKSGEIVSITDVSPIEHNVGVKVKSKNKFQPFIKDYTATQNGVTITVEQGKSVVSLNGTATSNTQRALLASVQNLIELKAGQTYCLSAKSIGGVVGDCAVTLNDSTSTILGSLKLGNSAVYTPTQDVSAYIGIHALSGATFENAEIVWQLEEGTTATAITPFVEDLTAVSVKKYGKNLCEIKESSFTQSKYYDLQHPLRAGIEYTLSAFVESNGTDSTYSSVGFYNGSDTAGASKWILRGNRDSFNFIPTKDVTRLFLYAETYWANSAGDTATFKDILITPKGNDTKYEPFIEPTTYTPNENGIVEGVTSLSPNMTLTIDTSGVIIDAEYNRDINKAFAELQNAIINLGGTL